MRLKPFAPDDAAGAAALHAACFPDPWPAHAFTTLLETGAEGFVIAETEFTMGAILFRSAADEAEILTFAVHPDMRNRGLGMRLMLQTIAALEAQGIARLLLEVAEDNQAALALYTRVGFQTVGERAGYYAGATKPIDAWIMSRQIAAKPADTY